MGLHPAEFRNRCGVGRPLRLSRRPPAGHRDLLRRESRRDRPDPALLLPVGEARHGRLGAMGDRRGLPDRHGDPAGRSGAVVHRRRDHWHSLLRQVRASAAGDARDSRRAGRGAACACRVGLDPRQASLLLPQGGLTDLRQWAGDRAIPGAGAGAAVWLAGPAAVPHRGRRRHDQPRAGGHHRHAL
jgi:hypothetical protein